MSVAPALRDRPCCPGCGRPLPVRSAPHNKGAPLSPDDLATVYAMAGRGETIAAVAAALGRSRSGVHRVMQALREAGELSRSPRLRNRLRPPPSCSAATRAALDAILGRPTPDRARP